MGVFSKVWCWSWNSNTLATWCEVLTHLKRPWCWEILRAWGEGDDRGWDGWMASPTQWTWVWVNSWCWWWTGRPGMLQFMGSQRVRHDWGLNWTELEKKFMKEFIEFLHSTPKPDVLIKLLLKSIAHSQSNFRELWFQLHIHFLQFLNSHILTYYFKSSIWTTFKVMGSSLSCKTWDVLN